MLNMKEPTMDDELPDIADLDVVTAQFPEFERLGRELGVARQAFDQLFPCHLPPVTGLDYCGASRPALEVGGDYFDFLNFLSLPSPKLGIAIGDVSGKGIPAAMLMPILRTSLRGLTIFPYANLAAWQQTSMG